MPTAILPFGPVLETTSEEIAGGSPEAFNVLVDIRGTLRKRPGIKAYPVAGSGVVDASGVLGLYVTDARTAHTDGTDTVSGTHPAVLYAVGATVNAADDDHPRGRNIYRVEGGSATLLTGTADEDRLKADALADTRQPRPQFVETEALLVIAGGDEIAKIDIRPETFTSPNFATNADYHDVSLLGGCPPLASFLVTNSSRLLANDTQLDQTKVRYSDINQGIVTFAGHESWDPSPGAAGFFTAEAKSDSIVAIAENTNDIYIFGRRNLQLFIQDGQTTFAPTSSLEIGCLAPYSVVKIDDGFVWIDHVTRIVKSNGREFNDIGSSVQLTLDQFAAPEDCYAYRFSDSFADCLVFRFEEDEQTLVWQAGVGWARWAQFNATTEEWDQFPVLAHHQRADGGLNVVGLEDGTIRLLTLDADDDLGTPIVAYAKTGFLDREADERKTCSSVSLTFKLTPNMTPVTCYLDYRDDLSDEWNSIPIELSTHDGNLTPTIVIRSLGVYYRRQWLFRFPETGDMKLIRASEKFKVEGRDE
jgi:hypothetical protein